MMNPNPEESKKRAEELREFMENLLAEEMKKPGKNGPTLDSLIPEYAAPKMLK